MNQAETSSLRVAVIGAGNVAGHLAEAFAACGNLVGVWSRNGEHAREIAAPLQVRFGQLNDAPRDCDAYVIAVKDDAIREVSVELGDIGGIVAHTSGTAPLSVLVQPRRGVFYPLQTFSRGRHVEMSDVPFFIEGSDEDVSRTLMDLARSISGNVRLADSDIRATLHLAAVFACNFANHSWAIAEDILQRQAGCTLQVFAPLLRETLAKAFERGAAASQTGPASRGDVHTIERHLQQLDGTTAEVYRIMSQSIMHNTFK